MGHSNGDVPSGSPDEEMLGKEYRIRLENYYGPLDLLLYLIKQHELDILRVPIAEVAGQYIQYINEIRKLDIDVASEFIVMAATLMRFKSRELTPDPDGEVPDEELEDPREELVQNLIRYRSFKDRARALRRRNESFRQYFSRPDLRERFRNEDERPLSGEEMSLSLWPLVRSYANIQDETVLEAPSTIVYDDVPQEIIMERIMERIRKEEQTTFMEIIGPDANRFQAVSYFLGILELANEKKLHLIQDGHGGEISIAPGPDATS